MIYYGFIVIIFLLQILSLSLKQYKNHHLLIYCLLFQNAYTATAINGTDFCTSAKDALKLLSKNSSQFTSVNCFGDFIIFLGKVRSCH